MIPTRSIQFVPGLEVRGRTVVGRLPANSRGVHSNAEAARAGLRGGIVVNEFHFSQISHLLVECLGDIWFTTGEIEVRYVHPLYDGNELTPVLRVLDSDREDDRVRFEVWCENQDGVRISVGTAHCERPGA